jgi:hypothetical protein
MELSVNSIVVLVVAITMLGLILGFVSSKFNSLNTKVNVDKEPDPIQASPTDPITVSRDTVRILGSNVEEIVKISILNTETNNVCVLPLVTCAGTLKINATAPMKLLNSGDAATLLVKLRPSGNAAGKNICTLSANWTPQVSGGSPAAPLPCDYTNNGGKVWTDKMSGYSKDFVIDRS